MALGAVLTGGVGGAHPENYAARLHGPREVLGVRIGGHPFDDVLDRNAADGGANETADEGRRRPTGQHDGPGRHQGHFELEFADQGGEHVFPLLAGLTGDVEGFVGTEHAEVRCARNRPL